MPEHAGCLSFVAGDSVCDVGAHERCCDIKAGLEADLR